MSRRTFSPGRAIALLCFVFFLSGAAALLFETLWFRLAGIALGNSVWASAIVLASFMAGLALGNAIGARYGERIARPIVAYAWAEVFVAGSGLALVLGFPALTAWLVPLFRPFLDLPGLSNLLRVLVSFGLMLIPAGAMGLTLPLLVKALCLNDRRFGSVLGLLYGWNTLGAVAGALAGEMALVSWLGIRGTAYVAAALNLTPCAVAFALRSTFSALPPGKAAAPPSPLSPRALRLLLASFLAGGILLALEVVWLRLLQLFVIGTSFAFAVMLATVLLGIGAGGLLASRWLALQPGAQRWVTALCLASGAATAVAYGVFEAPADTLAGTAAQGLGIARLTLTLALPVSLLSGMLFTLIGESAYDELGVEARTAGWVTLANTAGALVGSLAGGFVLLPRLGVERSLFALALAYGAVALATLGPARRLRSASGFATALLGGIFVLTLVLFPFGSMTAHLDQASRKYRERFKETTIAVREGLTGTLQYLRRDFAGEPLNWRLLTNAHSMSGTALDSKRYMRMYVWWPVAVHPDLESALLIGYGLGTTARALADTRQLDTIEIVEISRDILEMSRVVHPDPAQDPLRDPRVRVHVGDGRYFLQTTDSSFDLITAEPPPPVVAGAVNLYSREYFGLIHDRLKDGGYVTYWLPVQQITAATSRAIIKGFCDVFADCSLWAGCKYDWMLVGSRGARGAVSPERFARQWSDPIVAPEMAALGLEKPEQLGATFIADAERLREFAGDAKPLVDDRPKRLSLLRAGPADQEEYRRFMDLTVIAPYFERSSLIGDRWPAALRAPTRGYFRYQEIANMLVFPDDPQVLRMIDGILNESPLRTAALWLMASSADHERIVRRLVAAGKEGDFDLYLGASALADRDYETGVRYFGREPQSRPTLVEPLQIYSLCRLGETAKAQERAEAFRATHGREAGYSCW